jgi:superfamily II DNA or RNA helicase
MRALRDYQTEAVEAVRAEWAAGRNRTAVVMATGLGKTDCIAKVATDEARAGGRVLILAHRGELLGQIAERCGMHAPEVPVGWVQAARNEHRRRIVVASSSTLANEARRLVVEPPSLVIVDECHHAASPGYVDILSWAGSFNRTRTMGVTATLIRGDRRGLGDVWQTVAFARDIGWAISRGWLVQPRGRVVVADHVDLAAVKTSGTTKDYATDELGAMVAQDVDQVVKAWHEHAADRITVAFVPSVESAQALAEEFRAAGVPTGEVYGGTPRAERDRVYRQLGAGRLRVLVSVMVTTEGWDCPPVSCVLMARPTKLPGLYQQIVGRGLRTSPGKTDCLVLDVVGASRTQRLVTLTDLSPSAEYDTDELDALPCPACGLPPERCCPPGEAWCMCKDGDDDETGGRMLDPDGGRRRLLGPARYEDVELFAASPLNWLFTRGGIRFLPAGDRIAVLWPDAGKDSLTYSAGHVNVRGQADGKWLDDHAPRTLGEATALAEAWAGDHDPTVARRGASWRRRGGSPSEAQLGYARRLGIADGETMNVPRLSDEISIVLASRRLDR